MGKSKNVMNLAPIAPAPYIKVSLINFLFRFCSIALYFPYAVLFDGYDVFPVQSADGHFETFFTA
jgi:hypothetical protein